MVLYVKYSIPVKDLPMEETIKQHLRLIFPQVNDVSIGVFMEEAKRSNVGSNLADILLPACIDLILRSQSRNQNNAVTQPNDDVIFVASKKVELNNEVNNKRHAVVYIDDEKSDSEDEEGVIHSEPASDYQVFLNSEEVEPMFQPSPTTVGSISLLDELSQTFSQCRSRPRWNPFGGRLGFESNRQLFVGKFPIS